MKKILVLTDLSDQSLITVDAAITMSAKLNANLLLFNSFIAEPVLPEYGGNPWSVQELTWMDEGEKKLNYIKEEAETIIEGLSAAEHHASVDCRQGMGGLGGQVKDLLGKENIEMVVMGARTGSAWDHILMGSDTVSVINHANRPVLVIPAAHAFKKLKKVTLATDLDEADINAVHYLTRLGRLFDFSIDIVHVKLWGDDTAHGERRAAFEKRVARFNFPEISYHYITGKDLVSRLNRLCRETGTDLLALVHDKHSLLNRLFHSTQAKSLLEKQELPALIIPARLKI